MNNMVRLMELSVPLIDHPSDGFLAKLEEDLMKLLLEHGTAVGLEFPSFFVDMYVRYILDRLVC